ncbi:MAG: hypothetical protein BWY19_01130 [bacterium ADurb.Bin212]|jgi:hypothetical protein|nr:MAG: hypothetical protein BWY19_01130 [bacterium ADurb.Bin212]
MLFTAHALSSGVAGESIGNAFLAILLGIFVHFVMDSIPHYDTTDDGKFTFRQILLAGTDLLLGCVIIYLLSKNFALSSSFYWGVVGGLLPDFFSLMPPVRRLTERYFIVRKFQEFHNHIQKIKLGPILGLAVQIVIWLISICLLIYMQK